MNAATTEGWDDSQDPRNDEIAVETVRGYSEGQETVIFFGNGECGSEDFAEVDPELVVERSEVR